MKTTKIQTKNWPNNLLIFGRLVKELPYFLTQSILNKGQMNSSISSPRHPQTVKLELLGTNMKNNSLQARKHLLITCALLLSFSGLSNGAFKYAGEHGETIYSQFPPKSSQAEQVILDKKPNPTSKKSAVEVLERFTRDKADRQRTAQKLSEEKKNTAIKRQNCIAAKHNLTIYSGSPNRLIKGGDGNYARLTNDERQARLNTARKNIKEFCK